MTIEPLNIGLYAVVGFVVFKVIDHAVAYFWRMLTKQDKYITKQDLRLYMQDILKDFNKSWCGLCDTKRDKADINCLVIKIDIIKKILVELAIKANIHPDKIAELTQSASTSKDAKE